MKFSSYGIIFHVNLLVAFDVTVYGFRSLAQPRSHSCSSSITSSGSSTSATISTTFQSNQVFANVPAFKRSSAIWLASEDSDFDDDDEEDNNPLKDGVDSVSWLPSVVDEKDTEVGSIKEGAELLPLFPLGGFVYTPNTEHVLNIFEPRYRQMYTDILMNGAKRFVVVTSHPTEPGRFAQTGVLFELEDLKEVSEQTGDKIKYICNHKVTGRVRIHRILNPEAWESRDTYLKIEGTIEDDSGKGVDEPKPVLDEVYGSVLAAVTKGPQKEETELQSAFATLVDLQHELEEDVRFTRGSVETLAVKEGSGKDGLWQTVRLWQSFVDQRLMARQNELQRDFQQRLKEFLQKEKGVSEDELPSAIGFQELSPALQKELQKVQKLMKDELQPLTLESSLTMQKILEAPDHKARCTLLKFFMESETRRLITKKKVSSIFSGLNAAMADDDNTIPPEERISDSKKSDPDSKSLFLDEPDSFQ